jgi:ABC-type multidrug transport system ATPase subunit/ABC-type multidrug transport system permease subunit
VFDLNLLSKCISYSSFLNLHLHYSTLLDLLAGRIRKGTWSGDVSIDGKPRSEMFGRESAYVQQDDVHIATLTVEETIMYAAWSRLPQSTSWPARMQRVEELLEIMGLTSVRNNYVGDAFLRGISGGQKRRLSMAVELVALPRLLFLDEPTSGLDSAIAFEVMSSVRDFITSERTCLCTIHQPSAEIFSLFDKLVLMTRGRLIYFGSSSDAAVYFTQPELGYIFDRENKNPAEFVIEVSCGERLPEGFKTPRQAEELEVLYKSSRFYRPAVFHSRAQLSDDTKAKSAAMAQGSGGGGGEGSLRIESDFEAIIFGSSEGKLTTYATTVSTQLKMLLHRGFLSKIRDTTDLQTSLCMNLFTSIVLGLAFYQKGADLAGGPFFEYGALTGDASSVSSLLFFLILTVMIMNIQAIPLVCNRIALYIRETEAHAYRTVAFCLAQVIVALPFQMLNTFIMTTILYWMVGFNSNAGTYIYFWLMLLVGNFTAFVSVLVLASVVGDEKIAAMAFVPQFLVLGTFMGYSITLDNVPIYWKWFTYVSYPRWVFEGLMVNEFNQYATDDHNDDDQQMNGYGDVLEYFGFDNGNKWTCLCYELIFFALLCGVFYVTLLPARVALIKVTNAEDPGTVLSVHSSITDIVPQDIRREKFKNGKKKHVRGQRIFFGAVKTADLSDILIEGTDDSTSYDDHPLVVDDPLLEHAPHHSVESYRQSSGVVEESQGCHLVFHDVSYKVPSGQNPAEEVSILKNITGRASPGEMVALMGSSGAGKSTLLDILSQRKDTGVIEGSITYNGHAHLPSFAYVMQDNVHMGILTVRESLHYAAELRINRNMSQEAKAKRVEKILAVLALQEVAEQVIGSHMIRGISGGQLKRVSIGVEIVHLPCLMFLDEPTTGLDSSTALEVMCAIRNLANQNRTVLSTIHQPSGEVFSLFDSLLLLSEGRVVFFGPAAEAKDYFVQSPYQFVHKAGANPADFVVAVAGSFVAAADGRSVSAGELATYYKTTEYCRRGAAVDASVQPAGEGAAEGRHDQYSNEALDDIYTWSAMRHQLKVLLSRQLTALRRNPMDIFGPIIRFGDPLTPPMFCSPLLLYAQFLLFNAFSYDPYFLPGSFSFHRDSFIGLFYGSVYFQLETGDSCDSACAGDRISLLFFIAIPQMLGHLDNVVAQFDERLLYYRERGAGTYGPLVYWLSSLIVKGSLIPLNVLGCTVFVYPMAGLRAGNAGVVFYFVLVLFSLCSYTLALLVSALTPTSAVGSVVFPVVVFFCLLFGGFLIHLGVMADWQSAWLPYIDPVRYALQALVLNEFQDNSDIPNSSDYISNMGFNLISIEGCVALIFLLLGICTVAFYLALRYFNFESR